MNNLQNNGQSAAKPLEIEESSTTIPRKGSTTLKKLEKVDIKIYSLKYFPNMILIIIY